MVKAIVGANWGDEGKGKITDLLAESADYIVRYQGGSNAGHTIINEYGRFALHLLPSGIFYPHTINVIGPGVALNIEYFMKEINSIKESAAPNPNIIVSDRAQLLLPYHVLQDMYEEERLGKAAFGSTKSGIAPFYSDKYSKIGIQVSELFDEEGLYSKVENICSIKNALFEHLYKKEAINPQELYELLLSYRDQIKPYVRDVHHEILEAIKSGKTILLEGQLGSLKDTDHGIYPMVTSSSTLASFGATSLGIAPYYITDVMAVVKAYSSAVGAGEFVSEIHDEEEAQQLRIHGGDKGEFGATTGRPRRMGWFDIVATKYGVEVQGATEVVLTAIDCLSYLKEIPVCVAYEIEKEITQVFPNTTQLKKAKPVLEVLPGWHCDIRGITEFEKLPKEAQQYVLFIEKALGVKISIVSTGPKRHEIIRR